LLIVEERFKYTFSSDQFCKNSKLSQFTRN